MKDATVSARVEIEIKNEAEAILQKLGIPVSVLINSLYRQIIYRQGIPFPLTITDDPAAAVIMNAKPADIKPASAQPSVPGERPYEEVFDELGRNVSDDFLCHHHDDSD